MITPTATILVNDGGKYNKTFIQIMLQRFYIDGDEHEQLMIKYGSFQMFLPLSLIKFGKNFLLSAAMVGKVNDIKLTAKEFIATLERLGSREKLTEWKYVLEGSQETAETDGIQIPA